MVEKFTNESTLLYFGCIEQKRNISEVARDVFPENKQNSVRTSLSRKDAVEDLMEKDMIEAKKDGGWKYQSKTEEIHRMARFLLEEAESYGPKIDVSDVQDSQLKNVFDNTGVLLAFKAQNLKKVMKESVISKTIEKMGFYIKSLFVSLTGSRMVITDLQIKEGPVRIDHEKAEELIEAIKFLKKIKTGLPIELVDYMEIFVEIGQQVDITEIPYIETETVRDMSEVIKEMIESLTHDEVNQFFEHAEASPA